MRQLLAMILIAMLALSHGIMSSAAPHGEHGHHGDEVTIVADHTVHSDATERMDYADQEPAKAIGHGSHIHLAADLGREDGLMAPPVRIAASIYAAVDESPPPSRSSAPLLEPPAA